MTGFWQTLCSYLQALRIYTNQKGNPPEDPCRTNAGLQSILEGPNWQTLCSDWPTLSATPRFLSKPFDSTRSLGLSLNPKGQRLGGLGREYAQRSRALVWAPGSHYRAPTQARDSKCKVNGRVWVSAAPTTRPGAAPWLCPDRQSGGAEAARRGTWRSTPRSRPLSGLRSLSYINMATAIH